MKNLLISSLRAAAFASTLFAFAASAHASDLTATGSLWVAAAGPYVNHGTCRVQVSAKLGRPSATLPDGTWLYEGFTAGDRSGTLVVRFSAGRVSDLALASPAVVTALLAQPTTSAHPVLIAAWNQR
jgi:hypothetical protein